MGSKYCQNNQKLKDIRRAIDFLKTIADKNRFKILCALEDGEQCVCKIWQNLGIRQNLASHHLNILKNMGLINSRKKGVWVFYSLNQKKIKSLKTLLNNFLNRN